MSKILKNDDNLVKKASYLRIFARDLAENLKNGNFRSLFKGRGIEFKGVRDYICGDDVRAIDWSVTARMGRAYVKTFEEYKELQIFLVADVSASMTFEVNGKSKYDVASEAAALLTIACELNSCPIGAVFFDGQIRFSVKPALNKNQTLIILNKLDNYASQNVVNGSALDCALNGASKLLKKRSLVFVFSDFRTQGWQNSMISLAQKNDVICVRLRDDFDDELPPVGTAAFEDVESGKKIVIPASSQKFKKAWRNYNQQNEKNWQNFCSKHGILPVLMNTNDEPLQILNSALKTQGK